MTVNTSRSSSFPLLPVSGAWRPLERVRSVRCPARSAHSRPCGAHALASKASLDSERCDVMKREARSSRWDAGAQQASAHRELTTTMTTSWYLHQKFIWTLCTFVLRQHWLSLVFCVVLWPLTWWIHHYSPEVHWSGDLWLGSCGTCWFCVTATIWMWSIL